MTPRKKNLKLEHTRAISPTDLDVDEEDARNDEIDKNDRESAIEIENQLGDEQMQAEPETKKISSKRTSEDKAATKAHNAAATEALLSDRFVWKGGKPEPFERLRQDLTVDWEQAHDESHCHFVDRLHMNWEALEQETQRELVGLRDTLRPTPIDNDGEVSYVNFMWKGRKVHCEIFLKVALDDSRGAFSSSKILENFDRKMAEYDTTIIQDKDTRARLVQYLVAKRATDAELTTADGIKGIIRLAYEEIDDRDRDRWIADGEKAFRGEQVPGFPKSIDVYRKRYKFVTDHWDEWGRGGKEWTTDKKLNNDRNLIASDPGNDILRRPAFNGDTQAIYIAFDKNNKLIIFLDPQGIPWSYNENIHALMKNDAHEFYSKVKQPEPGGNKRHVSQHEHLKDNPELKLDWCGSDHYGHWHAQQHTHDPIFETGDSLRLSATNRQLLLQLLKYTGGPMTRVLDFWFGVWEPDLRRRYRDIYAKSPEFARLPPVNADHPETYCLRVTVCNRPTDEHRDQSDIKGGLTGLVHLGEFEGAAMCINRLGIALDGYGDGAMLLFRGTELKHYISRWSGKCRYGFDHTTHQSVENAVLEREKTGRWAPKKDPEGPKARKGGKRAKKPDDDEDDKKSDGGDAPAKPQPKKRKRQHDDDEDEEPDQGPSSKRPKKSLPNRPVKGGPAKKARIGAGQEDQAKTHSAEQVPEHGHDIRPRRHKLTLVPGGREVSVGEIAALRYREKWGMANKR